MKGDKVVIEEHHRKAAAQIVSNIIEKIRTRNSRYSITVAGESGSGKSETGRAIAEEFERYGLKSVVLGQDDYFFLPPILNDKKRREEPGWLGPHVEVNFEVLEENFRDAVAGKTVITKPLIDYNSTSVEKETIRLDGIKVVIAEGTYASLLKYVDTRIFIARSRRETLEHRKKRSRGGEAEDPFIENLLELEHKIIAGHKFLADFIITKEYDVIVVDK